MFLLTPMLLRESSVFTIYCIGGFTGEMGLGDYGMAVLLNDRWLKKISSFCCFLLLICVLKISSLSVLSLRLFSVYFFKFLCYYSWKKARVELIRAR